MTGVVTTPGWPPGAAAAAGPATGVATVRHSRPGRHRVRVAAPYVAAAAGYLLLSVALWWHAWSTHPAGVASCGCDDPAFFLWFLEWPAYALAHGHNPLFSTALLHPTGIDLPSNTSILALGIPLAPVTWLFGPVAALNVASTLGPAASALAMFWLLRRWVAWAPAAFVGGLLFGFSPYVIVNVAGAHLMSAVLAPLPLIVGCLDELVIRQRRSPTWVGLALGLLVVVQFFLSTEVLAMTAVLGAVGLALVAGYGALRRGPEVMGRLAGAGRGLAVAAAVAVVLLAYPVWDALAGPAHLAGPVWPGIKPGTFTVPDLWRLHFSAPATVHLFAGYQGAAGLPYAEYLGVGLLVVLGAGLVAFHRDRRLWLFGALGALSVWLMLDAHEAGGIPWRLLRHVPVVDNIIPDRFMAMTTLCAAVLLGLVVDDVHGLASRIGTRKAGAHVRKRAGGGATEAQSAGGGDVEAQRTGGGATIARAALSGAVALGVAAVALVPVGSALAGTVPLTVVPVTLPRWFTEVAPTLPPGRVVLTYPPPVAGGAAMAWQAVDGMRFALATGPGPDGIAARAGAERPGLQVLTSGSLPLGRPAAPTVAHVDALRQALRGWGVTTLVVPDPEGLQPAWNRRFSTAWGLGMFTLALARPPLRQSGAWVWDDVTGAGPPRRIERAAFAACTVAPARPGSVPACVQARSSPG